MEARCQATECQDNAHLKDNLCVADTIESCGSEDNDCTSLEGWNTGKCENGKCIITTCQNGFCLNTQQGQCTSEQSISTCGIDGGACLSCNPIKQVCDAGQCTAKPCEGNVCNQTKDSDETLVCKNDDTHCGSGCQNCNTFTDHATAGICNADSTCQVTACETDYHIYNNACEADSATNCGEHDKICLVENANNKCINKTCTFTCNTNYHTYHNACEADSLTNCGAHDAQCHVENATNTICSEGMCQATSCETGYHIYNNACEADSLTNCGAHDAQCHVENATNTCLDGQCSFTCDEGYGKWNNTCAYVADKCGNGILDNGEPCDDDLFMDVDLEPCLPGFGLDIDAIACTDNCQIDTSNVCVSDKKILLTEVVPVLDSQSKTIAGLALEFSNMSMKDFDTSSCVLNMFKEDGTVIQSYSFSGIGLELLSTKTSVVVCSQTQDYFDGHCDVEITDDLIQHHISEAAFMSMNCDETDLDIFNLNSFMSAVNRDAVDFVRKCSATPVTEPANAKLDEGWAITAISDYAPVFGLGEHCVAHQWKVESCTYTVSTNTLTDRTQNIDQALIIKIPHQSDRTNHTDVSPSVAIRFIAGKLSDEQITKQNIHYIWPKADTSWTNADGIDRYIGTLHNYDLYEGFISGDEGSYVLDAAISFDNEQTWTYCGPKGIIADYTTYIAEERNLLEVSYEESTCGDGVISGSEVCDAQSSSDPNPVFLEESLVCEEKDKVVTDRSKVKCYDCNYINTIFACEPAPNP